MKINQEKGLLFSIFSTGAIVLILEVSAIRLLAPVYGSSLYVLSSVLTTVLGALGLGYWYGGKRADKDPSIIDLYRLITWSGLGVFLLLVLAKTALPALGIYFSDTFGPLIFSLLLFLIPTVLLGMISPYVVKLLTISESGEKIGQLVGGVFFWGTAGSIAGSLGSGFVLLPKLGVTNTIILSGALLVIIGISGPYFLTGKVDKSPGNKIAVFCLILSLGFSSVFNRVSDPTVVYVGEGLYSSIKIKDYIKSEGKQIRVLYRDKNNSAGIYLDSKKLLFPYFRFSLLIKEFVPNAKKVLFLGGGGYSIPRTMTYLHPDLDIDVVEIEPVLFELSQKYLDLSDVSKIQNYVMDARYFLNHYPDKKYDLIFIDVFSKDGNVPSHLTTKEFYQSISKHLDKDGVMMMNTTGSLSNGNDVSMSGSVVKTLREVFPLPVVYTFKEDVSSFQNIFFLAKNEDEPIISDFDLVRTVGDVYAVNIADLNLDKEMILTDDHSPIEYLAMREKRNVGK